MISQDSPDILYCAHCGNTSIQTQLISQPYTSKFYGVTDGEETLYEMIYYVFRCETCKELLIYNLFPEASGSEDCPYGDVVYPKQAVFSNSVPAGVRKIYNEAAKVKNLSPIAYVILARRVLEEICQDKKVTQRNLARGLQELVDKGEIPTTLSEATELIRVVGNAGAHASDKVITYPQVWAIDEFIKVIFEYLYVAPGKIAEFKKTYGHFTSKQP